MIDPTFNKDSMYQTTINTLIGTKNENSTVRIYTLIQVLNTLLDQIKERSSQGTNQLPYSVNTSYSAINKDGEEYKVEIATNKIGTTEELINELGDSISSGIRSYNIYINEKYIIDYFTGLGYTIIDNRTSSSLQDIDFITGLEFTRMSGTITIGW